MSGDGKYFTSECGGVRLSPVHAIVIYSVGGKFGASNRTAMVHRVEEGELGPGAPLDMQALHESVLTSQGMDRVTYVPRNIVALSQSKMVWWTPAARRPIYFTEKVKGAKDISGKDVWHPPLLFVAGPRRVRCFALASNRRPDPQSKLYMAPYLNVFDDGGICQGQIVWPKIAVPSLATEFEKEFFASVGTHQSSNMNLTTLRGGHIQFWKAMRRRKCVPRRWLIPTQYKLKNLLNE
jgi:PRTRC genetic system protein B